ncbi:MAG: N-acetylneuraminate lyase [Clostridia bacterium]|nr:N-acetylneuraminate lyase [Clostridia bacterium]
MKSYKGIYTALLTPFTPEGKINAKELEKLVAHNLKMGVSGFYVCGSTGEGILLSADERKEIMQIVRDCAGDATLIAHVGALDERDAHKLAAAAKELGYDMISSVAPFYFKFTFEEIKNYYLRLAENSGMPMLVYHIPALSGVGMGAGEISEFLGDDHFIGVKFTSNDFFTMEQIRTRFPQKIIYNGYDEMMLSGLAMGADGGIGSTYNFMADKFVQIQKLFGEGKIEEAREVQKEANRIIAVLCRIGVMIAEKEVMNQLGLDFGICKKPFGEVKAEERELIAKEILPYIAPLA